MRLLALLTLLTVLGPGCGYGFQALGEPPPNIKSIAVLQTVNSTSYSALTNSLTQELVHQIIRSGLDVLPPGQADAQLSANIIRVEVEGAARTRMLDSSAARRVAVVVGAELKENREGRVIWSAEVIMGRQEFFVTENQSTVEANRNKALNDAARQIAEKIRNLIFEEF